MGEDWNIEDYRAAHESEEHWMLRREFMEANKSKFPRIRVLSLSQVFANVEFLGCKYPAETMQLVAELSEGIVEEYRQKQKSRLQRTFVKASTAAENRSKGDGTVSQSQSKTQKSTSVDTKAYRQPLGYNFVSAGQSTSTETDTDQTEPSKKMPNLTMTEPSRPGTLIFERSVKSVVSRLLDRSSELPSTSFTNPSTAPPARFSSPTAKFSSPATKHSSPVATGVRAGALIFERSVKSVVSNILDRSSVSPSTSTTTQFPTPTARFTSPSRPATRFSSSTTRFYSPAATSAGPGARPKYYPGPGPGIRPLMGPANARPKSNQIHKIKQSTDIRDLVLVEQLYTSDDTAAQVLNRSCSMSHVHCTFKLNPPEKNRCVCTFSIGTFVVQGAGLTKEAARSNSAELALERLKKSCYTIQIRQPIVGTGEIGKQELDADANSRSSKLGASNALAPAVDQNNVGNKLLRLMGWTGGALGKNEDGMKEAIDVSDSIGRERLGLGNSKSLVREKVLSFLRSQIALTDKQDVIFSPEFSSLEREVIHKSASILGLKSRSYGKDDNRFLVVSRKISIRDLLKELLDTGETEKYCVVKPG